MVCAIVNAVSFLGGGLMTGSQQRGRRSGRVEDILDLLAEVSARIDKAIKPLEKAFDSIIFAAC
jgi:hypothetical protein